MKMVTSMDTPRPTGDQRTGPTSKPDNVPFQLEFMRSVWAVDRALQELSRVMGIEMGITGPQRLVLRVIGGKRSTSPKELAESLHLDPSTLTGHLQRLEGLGLILRETAATDGRRQIVRLSAAGRRLDVKSPGTVEAAVDQVVAQVPPESIAAARQVLEALAEALRGQAEKVDTRRTRKKGRAAKP